VITEDTERDSVFVECDTSDPDQVTTAIDAAEEFGGIDTMVNNAGILGNRCPLVEYDLEEYRRIMSINLDGVVYGAKAAAERMLEHDVDGSIINISSIDGIRGVGQLVPYSVSKGGVRTFTYALAAELGPAGIRVNAIHPGPIKTSMTLEDSESIGNEQGEERKKTIPLHRYGSVDEIADVSVFLASDLSRYVTAESIIVDGGMTNTS